MWWLPVLLQQMHWHCQQLPNKQAGQPEESLPWPRIHKGETKDWHRSRLDQTWRLRHIFSSLGDKKWRLVQCEYGIAHLQLPPWETEGSLQASGHCQHKSAFAIIWSCAWRQPRNAKIVDVYWDWKICWFGLLFATFGSKEYRSDNFKCHKPNMEYGRGWWSKRH